MFSDPRQQPDDQHTRFLSADGRTQLQLTVQQNPQNRAIADVYREWVAEFGRKGTISYKTLKGNWSVISGDAAGRGYYIKCIARDHKFFTMSIDYDEEADMIWEGTMTAMPSQF